MAILIGASRASTVLDDGSVGSDDGTFYASVEQLSGAPVCANLTLVVRNG